MSLIPSPAGPRWRVAVVGFSAFERQSLASFFRLAETRAPAYAACEDHGQADFLIADADQPRALALVREAGREADAVFVGARAPAGAISWLARPIEPTHIVRELDALVQLRASRTAAPAPAPADAPVDAPVNVPVNVPAQPDAPAAAAADVAAPVASAPTAAAPAPTAAPTAGPDPATVAAPARHGRRLLVVDDSPIARSFLKLRLERLGYVVDVAGSADEALAATREHAYTIVFLDVMLGEDRDNSDGLLVCQALRQRRAYAGPIVLTSGLSGATDKVRGTLAGADAYLTKPLMEPEFLATLRQFDPAFNGMPASAA